MFTQSFRALSPALATAVATILFLPNLQAADPTDPSVLKAGTWDQSVVIGPGGYRGGKIVSKSKPKHEILPGALIEKANFTAEGDVKWTIEGILARDTKFSGDLGTNLTAKDSAFEECMFQKSGGWFVGWAGTRWNFENCVFTRTFMPASFGVHDTCTRAVNCTFIGVKMPNFGLKKNPAQGVQGKDLQFLNCRFIGCDFPETALALTTDCSFENCQFDAKKHDWEKAEGPVNVKAYITAGRVPPSYVNGKLNVTFISGQPPQAAGARLEHTIAGARILTPWSQKVQTFAELGSLKKLASEIPVFAAGTAGTPPATPGRAIASTPQPAVPPALPAATPATPAVPTSRPMTKEGFFNLPETKPAPAPIPAVTTPSVPPAPVAVRPTPAAPTVKEIRNLDELLLSVPLEQQLVVQGRINPAALEAANAILDQSSAGKPVALRVPVEELAAHRVDGYAFKVRGQLQPLSLRGQAVSGRVEALFRADQAAALSRVAKGSQLALKGMVSKAELGVDKRSVTFTVTIADARLQ